MDYYTWKNTFGKRGGRVLVVSNLFFVRTLCALSRNFLFANPGRTFLPGDTVWHTLYGIYCTVWIGLLRNYRVGKTERRSVGGLESHPPTQTRTTSRHPPPMMRRSTARAHCHGATAAYCTRSQPTNYVLSSGFVEHTSTVQ
jgi:hypothetical protein